MEMILAPWHPNIRNGGGARCRSTGWGEGETLDDGHGRGCNLPSRGVLDLSAGLARNIATGVRDLEEWHEDWADRSVSAPSPGLGVRREVSRELPIVPAAKLSFVRDGGSTCQSSGKHYERAGRASFSKH